MDSRECPLRLHWFAFVFCLSYSTVFFIQIQSFLHHHILSRPWFSLLLSADFSFLLLCARACTTMCMCVHVLRACLLYTLYCCSVCVRVYDFVVCMWCMCVMFVSGVCVGHYVLTTTTQKRNTTATLRTNGKKTGKEYHTVEREYVTFLMKSSKSEHSSQ